MPLIEIIKPQFNVELCLAYATDDNVTGKAIYKNANCYLHPDAAKCLTAASNLAEQIGLKIKIFDAFRPLEAQQALWDKFPDPEFVSDPVNGRTPHCRGIAVDLTLVDKNDNQLDMGTDFDAFTPLSHHANIDIAPAAQQNRHILMGIMTVAGWDYNPNEWWHYQLPNPTNYEKLTDKTANSNMM